MKTKYAREIKVGILAVVALFVLYFGFNFLKGVNIFTSVDRYTGIYANINGLTEQAPVYVRGYKVGQVDHISYDFTQENAFAVTLSINKGIILPEGTELALIADGLLGGTALQLNIPTGTDEAYFHSGDTLPVVVVPGLFDILQGDLLVGINSTIAHIDSLVVGVEKQLEGNHLQASLKHVETIAADLTVASGKLKTLMDGDAATLITDATSAVADIKTFSGNLSKVDIEATVNQIDTTVAHLNTFMAKLNSNEGTLGMLMNDQKLYLDITSAVNSADSLLTDLKAHPERYVQISVFGGKKK